MKEIAIQEPRTAGSLTVFTNKKTGSILICAYKKETSCTPDCVACDFEEGSRNIVNCLRGAFSFGEIV